MKLLLLLLLIFPLRIEPALGQPRQTPTINPTTTTDEDNAEEIDPEQAEQELDESLPKTEQNPLKKPNIDQILEKEFNDDLWRIMRGGLPCLETSSSCLQQLQEKAIANSPLLRELDRRIEEANNKVNEAKARNQRAIRLSVFTPALQYLLGPTPTAGQPQAQGKGLIDNLLGIFRGETGLINGLLNVIGIPLFKSVSGGNEEANRNAIAISDIQVKIAELQRSRAQLADTIRQGVTEQLAKFDESRTNYQVSQVVALRSIEQFKIYELRYIRGNDSTENYLTRQSRLDRTKANTYRAWSQMKRDLFKIKLLVLGIKDAEL